jgi:hypothetical protein
MKLPRANFGIWIAIGAMAASLFFPVVTKAQGGNAGPTTNTLTQMDGRQTANRLDEKFWAIRKRNRHTRSFTARKTSTRRSSWARNSSTDTHQTITPMQYTKSSRKPTTPNEIWRISISALMRAWPVSRTTPLFWRSPERPWHARTTARTQTRRRSWTKPRVT